MQLLDLMRPINYNFYKQTMGSVRRKDYDDLASATYSIMCLIRYATREGITLGVICESS